MIINSITDVFNILRNSRTKSYSCYEITTLCFKAGFNITIKSTVGFIIVLRFTLTVNIVIEVSTNYGSNATIQKIRISHFMICGNKILTKSPQLSLKFDREQEFLKYCS